MTAMNLSVHSRCVSRMQFSCREKLDQEKRRKLSGPPRSPASAGTEDSPKGADVARGIVKFLVDVFDETGETVAIATILTMVRKLDQS